MLGKPAGLLNSIIGGFSGGGVTSSARKKIQRAMFRFSVKEDNSLVGLAQSKPWRPIITFGPEDFEGIQPHFDDPMVVILRIANFGVKRVLIDQGSSADVLYYDAFQGLGLKVEQLKYFDGTLIGFSNEEVEVLGYIELEVVFGEGEHARMIPIKFLVIKCISTYNVIIGRTTINRLGAAFHTGFLTIKYPVGPNKVGKLVADQKAARECYNDALSKRKQGMRAAAQAHQCCTTTVDPREGFMELVSDDRA
jgi:hypothetical protein